MSRLSEPPQPLPVSPATLLSLVTSVIDLLSSKFQQRSGASSPLEIWQAEIQRYYREVRVLMLYTYNLYTERREWVASSEQ